MTFKVVEKMKSQKVLAGVYGENPDYKIQRLFVDSFLVVNVLKGLSNLIVASLKEDEYGIVQQNLGEILTLFIELQKVLLVFTVQKSFSLDTKAYFVIDFRKVQHRKAVL